VDTSVISGGCDPELQSLAGTSNLSVIAWTFVALQLAGKAHEPELTAVPRYRTQEVAGSSPASSIDQETANGAFENLH